MVQLSHQIVKPKYVFTLAFFFILFSPVLAQPKLEMKFIGYGSTYQEVHLSFNNAGNVTLSDITIYIDGKVNKTIEGVSTPGVTFEDILYLSPGKHLIEARTPEGAYASLQVTAMKGKVQIPTKNQPVSKPKKISENSIYLGIIGVVIVIVVFGLWLEKRRR